MEVLFLSRDVSGIETGAAIVTNRNLQLIKDTFGAENVAVKTILPVRSMLKTLWLTTKQYMGGLTPEIEGEVLTLIKNKKVDLVAIDSSLLGRIAKPIKKHFPSCRIIVFYHNTEYLYFKSLLKTTGKLWHQLSVWASYTNEQILATYADELITLNNRDAEDLFVLYNHKGALTLPVTYADRFEEQKVSVISRKETTALFVGTLFFPNYQGIKWFIDQVLPDINCKLVIVGKGFEEKREELSSSTVEVVGTVDDIAPYYYQSSFVVAPIFTGSGMKTKTAEALMFGCNIFGTTEAFEGYQLDANKIGGLCNTKEEFIRAITDFLNKKDVKGFNTFSRKAFLESHDYRGVLNKFRKYILQRNYNI